MSDELSDRERALRRLPLPYSLALRLRDGGVDPEVICEYIGVDPTSLAGVFRMAEAKLACLSDAWSGTSGDDPGAVRGMPAAPDP